MADKSVKPAKDSKKKKEGIGSKVKAFFGKIAKFFSDIRGELKKVVWPSKQDVKNNTLVVLVVVAIAVVGLIVLDTAFGGVMRLIVGA